MDHMHDMINLNPPFYGVKLVPKKHWKEYGYALLAIAGADGEVSQPEMDWLTLEMAQNVVVPEDIILAWKTFDAPNADLVELFTTFNITTIVSFNKILIYDAIRMSYADNEFSDRERAGVATAARLLNVDKDAIISLEALVELERAADKLRMTLI